MATPSFPWQIRSPRAWFIRWSSVALAMLAFAIPVMAFAEAWNVNHPLWQVIVKGRVDALSIALIVLCGLTLIPIAVAWILRDYEFLFGAATIAVALLALLTTLTVLMPWIAFSAGAGARWFGVLLVVWTVALTMIASDWVRKGLILASVVTAVALGGFIVRAGYNDLRATQHLKRADVVTAASTSQDQLAQQAGAAPATLVGKANAARQELVNVIFEVQPANIPAPLRQAAISIYQKTPTSYAHPVNQALVDNFDALAANQPATTAVVVTGLRIKTHAFVDAVNAAAARTTSPVAGLGRSLGSAIALAKSHLDDESWAADEHRMTVALAAYRAAVTGTSADQKAYQAALAAPLPPPGPGFGVLEAVTDGPQALWTGAAKKNLRPLIPGPLGWVLLGALALGIWGTLLRKNADQLAGPVSMPGDDKSDPKLVKVLRVAVLRNLDEPGAAPGASSANPVTDLIDVVGGPLTAFGKVLDIVYKVAGRRYGYEVTMDVATAGETTVLIRVKSIAGEQTFTAHVFTGDTDEKVVRTAGLWAAGTILERSSRVPSWAAWNAATAEALSTAFQDAPTTEQLQYAVREAPGSGLLLAMLGQRYELTDGKRIDAIEMYARAVAAHPRYIVARYRLGAALAAMRDDVAWRQLEPGEKGQLLASVQRAAVALHTSVEHVTGANPALTQADLFMALAGEFLAELDVDTRLVHRLVASLRRSDRDAIAPVQLIRWSSPASRFHPLVKSLRLAYSGKLRDSKIVAYASRPRRWWQVSYNAACGLAYHLQEPARDGSAEAKARAKRLDEALRMLEQTLVRPGIHQLRAEWVTHDVDLQVLKNEPRFKAYVKQLRTDA